jgi:hypothetical protein
MSVGHKRSSTCRLQCSTETQDFLFDMNSTRTIKALLLIVVASSCYSVATVHRTATPESAANGSNALRTEETGGIPFFVQHRVLVQTTEYTERWRLVRLDLAVYRVPQTGGEVKWERLGGSTLSAIVDEREERKAAYEEVLRALDSENWAELNGKFAALSKLQGAIEPLRELVGNYVDSVVEVDYATPHYLNVRAPWAGSAKFEPTLSADGTLSKVVADSVSRADALVPAIFPAKRFFGKVLGLVKEDVSALTSEAAPESGGSDRFVVVPTVVESTMGHRAVYTRRLDPLTTKHPSAAPMPDLSEEFQAKSPGVSLRRIPLDTSPKAAAAAEDDKKAEKIGFSGSVTLPKK